MSNWTEEFIKHCLMLGCKVHPTSEQYGTTHAFLMKDEDKWRFSFSYDPKHNDDQVTFQYWVGSKIYTIKITIGACLSIGTADMQRAIKWNTDRNTEYEELMLEVKELPKIHKRDLTILFGKV